MNLQNEGKVHTIAFLARTCSDTGSFKIDHLFFPLALEKLTSALCSIKLDTMLLKQNFDLSKMSGLV